MAEKWVSGYERLSKEPLRRPLVTRVDCEKFVEGYRVTLWRILCNWCIGLWRCDVG
jgi:hypothetical protein